MLLYMEKDENAVHDLLRKYYEGETSLEEENVLEEYFVSHSEERAEHGWFTGRHILKNEIPSSTLESEIVFAVENQRSRVALRPWYLGIAATLVFALLAFITYFTIVGPSAKLITVASGPAQQKITLADGSQVTLNTNTTFEYPETFNGDEREVWLKRGEAFFEVSEDPNLPFVVYTNDTRTEVVGTSFNIRARDAVQTDVTVITGTVSFNASTSKQKEKVVLHAGNAGTFHSREKRMKKLDTLNPNSIAWMTHQLEFKDAPVKEVFKTLETYFGVTIQTSDSSILSCRFRGSFKDADLAEIFEVMSFSLDLTLSEAGKTYTVSGKGCKPDEL
jgi:ferric-dicitrate binding protein FerR (iron transport regulator)